MSAPLISTEQSKEKSKKTRKRDLKVNALLIVIGSFATIFLFAGDSIFSSFEVFWKSWVWSLVIWITQVLGGGFLVDALEKPFPWVTKPRQRTIAQIILVPLYSATAITIVNYFFQYVYNDGLPDDLWSYTLVSGSIAIGVTLAVVLPISASGFLRNWRESVRREEELRNMVLTHQYESLRSQVNPHFLFNSLNVLTALVHENPDLAVRFIRQLSDVYRYVLDARQREIVPLSEEANFIERYVFLLGIRFEDGLQVDLDLKDNKPHYVLPMALQLLVENAVKHNSTSSSKPLHVKVYLDQDDLVVTNPLQPRTRKEEGSGFGLAHIRERYAALTDRPVVITDGPDSFTVRIPLLQIEKQEA